MPEALRSIYETLYIEAIRQSLLLNAVTCNRSNFDKARSILVELSEDVDIDLRHVHLVCAGLKAMKK